MDAIRFDDRPCLLGEGPLWHPERQQLFWFDILNRALLTQEDGVARAWTFEDIVSAAGWIDSDHLLIASQSALLRFSIVTGESTPIADLDIGEGMRTNDGRADPWGGFWISSMGLDAQKEAGAIYRFYQGEVSRLFSGITIANAICFSPDRAWAYFADTDISLLKRVALDPATGMPSGEAEIFIDFAADGINPDGAVTDAAGNLWIAQWGAGRVAAYDAEGNFLEAVGVEAPQSTCPAFGGHDFSTLYCTTAREGMDAEAITEHPQSGMVFVAEGAGKGKAEPRVRV